MGELGRGIELASQSIMRRMDREGHGCRAARLLSKMRALGPEGRLAAVASVHHEIGFCSHGSMLVV